MISQLLRNNMRIEQTYELTGNLGNDEPDSIHVLSIIVVIGVPALLSAKSSKFVIGK